jgi:hypothetical protein
MVDTYYVGLYPWVYPWSLGEDVPELRFDLGVDDQNRNKKKILFIITLRHEEDEDR